MCSAITYTPMTKVMLSGSLAKKFFRSKQFLLDGGIGRGGVPCTQCDH
ncbi:hypothetical protein PS925_03499 [Pseudomonas fluorescens]|uniref:Uncharacterized protein n=1 Tax=Pseudomonas fluorescens TaxID=294 RepID=A0A5E7UIP8_PSEFL|nr:hypothetical protein PS925_03499 [Pseudomonas fluorescens]